MASPMFVADSVEYLANLPQTEEGIVSKEAFVQMMGDIKACFSSEQDAQIEAVMADLEANFNETSTTQSAQA